MRYLYLKVRYSGSKYLRYVEDSCASADACLEAGMKRDTRARAVLGKCKRLTSYVNDILLDL